MGLVLVGPRFLLGAEGVEPYCCVSRAGGALGNVWPGSVLAASVPGASKWTCTALPMNFTPYIGMMAPSSSWTAVIYLR